MMSVATTARQSLASRTVAEVASWSATLKIGALMMLVLVLAAVFAPFVAPYDPLAQDFMRTLQPPSLAHPFGTDNFGRDIFSRVIFGARIDLTIGVVTTYVPLVYGVLIGAVSGYAGGRFDAVMMRVLDTAMAFPFLVLIVVILAILGPGEQNIFIAILLVGWTMYARLARAEMLVEKNKDYMTAARVLGYAGGRILFRHGLPNVIGSSIVFSMSDFVLNILLISGLSFIGLGIRPPIPEWGAMVAEGKDFMLQAWWIATMPGLAIVYTGTALALIGDGLARRLGERHRTLV